LKQTGNRKFQNGKPVLEFRKFMKMEISIVTNYIGLKEQPNTVATPAFFARSAASEAPAPRIPTVGSP
jgi:hypothetical protein